MSSSRHGAGLSDAQGYVPDADYVRKGSYFQSLTGVAITRLGNGDWFYAVDTTAADRTVTLPDVADEVGHHHIVKRITGGSNQCNIVAAAGLLDGSASHSIAAQYGVRCYFSDGDAWRGTLSPASLPLEGTWLTYTPTVTAGTGAFTTVSATGRYLVLGRTTFVQIVITITTNGTAGSFIQATLPNTAAQRSCIVGLERALAGWVIRGEIQPSSNLCTIARYDTAYTGADGYILLLAGTYEIA